MRYSLSSRGEAVAIQIKAASNLDCFAVARNDGLSSRVSETNVAIQIEVK